MDIETTSAPEKLNESDTSVGVINFIEEFYPEIATEQREEAAYYLNRYLDLIERIYERTHL